MLPLPAFVTDGATPVQPSRGRGHSERPDGRSRQGGVPIVQPLRSPNYERPNSRSRPPIMPQTPVIVGGPPRMPSAPSGVTVVQLPRSPSYERPDSRSRRPPTPVIVSDPSQLLPRGRRSSRTLPAVVGGREGRRTVSQPGVVVAGGHIARPTTIKQPENR
jgi:hypothetical protein